MIDLYLTLRDAEKLLMMKQLKHLESPGVLETPFKNTVNWRLFEGFAVFGHESLPGIVDKIRDILVVFGFSSGFYNNQFNSDLIQEKAL